MRRNKNLQRPGEVLDRSDPEKQSLQVEKNVIGVVFLSLADLSGALRSRVIKARFTNQSPLLSCGEIVSCITWRPTRPQLPHSPVLGPRTEQQHAASKSLVLQPWLLRRENTADRKRSPNVSSVTPIHLRIAVCPCPRRPNESQALLEAPDNMHHKVKRMFARTKHMCAKKLSRCQPPPSYGQLGKTIREKFGPSRAAGSSISFWNLREPLKPKIEKFISLEQAASV